MNQPGNTQIATGILLLRRQVNKKQNQHPSMHFKIAGITHYSSLIADYSLLIIHYLLHDNETNYLAKNGIAGMVPKEGSQTHHRKNTTAYSR
jgi:hypothetical protein